MTRFAIDAPTAIRLLRDGATVPKAHQLVGPTLLRSEALSQLYRDVLAGELTEKQGKALLTGIATMRIRLLGDRVSRQTAWKIAMDNGWGDTTHAEYLAVAQLQADYFVTSSEAEVPAGLVRLAPFSALTDPEFAQMAASSAPKWAIQANSRT